MIRIQILKEKNRVKGYVMKGHAGAGEYGQDIVCAGASALALNTANSIEALTDARFDLEASEDGGYLKLVLRSDTDAGAQLLLDSLYLGMKDMSESYPENIRIQEVEV